MKLSIRRRVLNNSAELHTRQVMTARHEGISAVMTALVFSALFIPTVSYPLVLNATSTNGSTLLALGGIDQQSFTPDFSECVCNQNRCYTTYAEVDPASTHDNASHVMSSEDVQRYDNITYFNCKFPVQRVGKLICKSNNKRNLQCNIKKCTINITFNCSSSHVAILRIMKTNNLLSVYHSSGLSIVDCCRSRTTVTNPISMITIPSSGNLITTTLTSLLTTSTNNVDTPTADTTSLTTSTNNVDTPTADTTSLTTATNNVDTPTADTKSLTTSSNNVDTPTADTTSLTTETNNVDTPTADRTALTTATNNVDTPTADRTALTTATNNVDTPTADRTALTTATNNVDNPTADRTALTTATNNVDTPTADRTALTTATNNVDTPTADRTALTTTTNNVDTPTADRTALTTATNNVDIPTTTADIISTSEVPIYHSASPVSADKTQDSTTYEDPSQKPEHNIARSQISTANIGVIVGAILAAILVIAIVVVIAWKKKNRGQLRRGDNSQGNSVPGLWSVDGTVERNNASSTTAPEAEKGERKIHARKTHASHANEDLCLTASRYPAVTYVSFPSQSPAEGDK